MILYFVACTSSDADSGPSAPDTPTDADADGYDTPWDCDDGDATIHPGADDPAGDGVDQDCDNADSLALDCGTRVVYDGDIRADGDDAVAELREAVDFLRYYAAQARGLFGPGETLPGPTGEENRLVHRGRGVFVCISPWNFPLAIFVGQVAAGLAAGNAVVAKPAGQTPLIAFEAVRPCISCPATARSGPGLSPTPPLPAWPSPGRPGPPAPSTGPSPPRTARSSR